MHETLSLIGFMNLPLILAVTVPICFLCSNYFRSTCKTSNTDRVVLITGCDSGIGLQLAKWCLEWGYYVVAGCLDSTSTGAELLRSLSVTVVSVNVCRKELVKNLIDEMTRLEQEGKVIWCLVNNAGIMTYAKTEWLTWEQIESQVLVNLVGTIQVTRSILQFLRESKGRVINVSSPQGIVSSPFMSVYCASKWGVEAFSHALRREVSPYGVRVVIVRPCNFPHKTLILKRNSQHLAKMKSEMSGRTLQEFGQEIEALQQTFESAFTAVDAPETINDLHLKSCFRTAIESRNPSQSYTAAPFVVRTLLGLLNCLPHSVVDVLVGLDLHNTIINWGRVA